MEVLAIGTAVASALTTTFKVSVWVSAIQDSYKNAPETVVNIASECQTLKLALSHIQNILVKQPNGSSSPFSDDTVIESFDMAILALTLTLSSLELEIQSLVEPDTAAGKMKWKKRVSFVWNESKMKEYLTQLRGQRGGIQFLHQVLDSMENQTSLKKIHEMLQQKQTMFQDNKRRAREFRSRDSRNPPRPADLESVFGAGSSLYGSGSGSTLDADLYSSAVYQKAREASIETLVTVATQELSKQKENLLREKTDLEGKLQDLTNTTNKQHQDWIKEHAYMADAIGAAHREIDLRGAELNKLLAEIDSIQRTHKAKLDQSSERNAKLESLCENLSIILKEALKFKIPPPETRLSFRDEITWRVDALDKYALRYSNAIQESLEEIKAAGPLLQDSKSPPGKAVEETSQVAASQPKSPTPIIVENGNQTGGRRTPVHQTSPLSPPSSREDLKKVGLKIQLAKRGSRVRPIAEEPQARVPS